MAIYVPELKTDWIDGDILIAGTTTSLSSVNGITYAINTKPRICVASNTLTTIYGSGGGTLGTYTISAGTVKTGIFIIGDGYVDEGINAFQVDYFANLNVQTGPSWGLSTRRIFPCYGNTYVPILYSETGTWTGHNWTNSTTIVRITTDSGHATTSSTLNSIMILGY